MLPKLVITDIDGVWTDGGMYYDNVGNEWKKFNTSDSAGVLLCRELNIPVVIITGENTSIVERRAQKLGVKMLYQGVKDKLSLAENIWKELNILPEETAFIGDDFGDVPLLLRVGFSGCPANTPTYIQKQVNWVGIKKGGEGAFREFIEHILHSENLLDSTVQKIIDKLHALR
jgi:3-deoxy-D-glycero-D-galacto-nononate 9-phosphatase